jgi:hypothetical protein
MRPLSLAAKGTRVPSREEGECQETGQIVFKALDGARVPATRGNNEPM